MFGILDADDYAIRDDKAHFLKEELFAGGHGVGMAKETLRLWLGREPVFVCTRDKANMARVGHGLVVHGSGLGRELGAVGSTQDEGVKHGETPVAIRRDSHGDKESVGGVEETDDFVTW